MLTASVNVVQSAWPENVQGDISGVSRSVSNLGSSLGVAIAGSLVAGASGSFGKPFALAIGVLGVFALIGWVAALLLPHEGAAPLAPGADGVSPPAGEVPPQARRDAPRTGVPGGPRGTPGGRP